MDEYINKKEIIRHLCLTTGCSYHDVVIGTIMKFPAADVRPLTDKEAKYLTEEAGWVKENHTPLVDIIEVIPEEKPEEKKTKRGRKSAK